MQNFAEVLTHFTAGFDANNCDFTWDSRLFDAKRMIFEKPRIVMTNPTIDPRAIGNIPFLFQDVLQKNPVAADFLPFLNPAEKEKQVVEEEPDMFSFLSFSFRMLSAS